MHLSELNYNKIQHANYTLTINTRGGVLPGAFTIWVISPKSARLGQQGPGNSEN